MEGIVKCIMGFNIPCSGKSFTYISTRKSHIHNELRNISNMVNTAVTCGSSSDGSVGVAAWHCPSVSDSASSSSTSWIVGVTSDGGMDVFFFFLFFFRRRSILSTLLRKRCGGRWVDRGWWVWWNVCRWSMSEDRDIGPYHTPGARCSASVFASFSPKYIYIYMRNNNKLH